MRNVTAKAVVIILAFSCMAFAQDFHFYPFTMLDHGMLGSGARARAMGGAFIGLSDDASALTWNPAGLNRTEKTHVAFSGNLKHVGLENSVNFGSGGYSTYASDYNDDLIQLSYASFVSPLRIKGHSFTLAAGYQKAQDYLDENVNWSLGALPFTISQGSGVFLNNLFDDTKFQSNLNEFLMGFGSGLYGDLAFGASVSVYSGNGSYSYDATMNDTVPVFFGGQIVDSVAGKIQLKTVDEVDLKAYSLKGGLMYQAEKFALGVIIAAPYELSYDHDLTKADTIFLKSISVPGQGIPSAPLVTLYRGKTKQEVPLTIGVGGSLQATENLVFSADFEYRGTSNSTYFVRAEEIPETARDSANLLTLPWSIYYNDSSGTSYYTASGDYVEIFNEFMFEYENSYQIRLGGEYNLATRIGTIPIRGGFRYSALPYRNATELLYNSDGTVLDNDYELGDQVTSSTVTFGSGVHWEQIWLDFAVEIHSEDQMQSGFYIRDLELVDYDNTRKRNNSSLILNFTGFF